MSGRTEVMMDKVQIRVFAAKWKTKLGDLPGKTQVFVRQDKGKIGRMQRSDPEKDPAAIWVVEIAEADGNNPKTIRSAGLIGNVALGHPGHQSPSSESVKEKRSQIRSPALSGQPS